MAHFENRDQSQCSLGVSRRRPSRWGAQIQALPPIGLETAITASMTSEQIDAYALHVCVAWTAVRCLGPGHQHPRAAVS
ncbi:Uu.00g050830.m01.CDS01 [Anthostomella pinea]|uniref:Uu.00g050830.m01.CDS01 n=1 Tax=Anthostomella pinea TaxID=933095 RepID=A0AAI8VSQ6_9PEZI|nr:Uu.00g050830.m01.CDS01 [Anthostomella pinea]